MSSNSTSHQYQSSTSNNTARRLGDIEHFSQLSENLSALYLNQDYSDVTLIVEGYRLPAHKVNKFLPEWVKIFVCTIYRLYLLLGVNTSGHYYMEE